MILKKETEINTRLVLCWEKFRRDGCQESLSAIYFECIDLLYNYGMKHTKDRQIIEDSIQNLFMYLLKSRRSLGPVNNLIGYLIRSFRHELAGGLKRAERYVSMDNCQEYSFSYFSNPEQDLIRDEEIEEIHGIIRSCIKKLTPKQQEIIFLRFECGLSYDDISSAIGLTVESCHTTVYRAIKAIRCRIDRMKSNSNINKISLDHSLFRIMGN